MHSHFPSFPIIKTGPKAETKSNLLARPPPMSLQSLSAQQEWKLTTEMLSCNNQGGSNMVHILKLPQVRLFTRWEVIVLRKLPSQSSSNYRNMKWLLLSYRSSQSLILRESSKIWTSFSFIISELTIVMGLTLSFNSMNWKWPQNS